MPPEVFRQPDPERTGPLGPVLAFDCSGPWIVAGIAGGPRPVPGRVEEMARGQAERLMPLLEELLAEAGLGWSDLAGIGVGIGPGNFTGIRIAVAAARGLALGLGVPAIGISGFEAQGGEAGEAWRYLPAPRGQSHAQLFRDGRAVGGPCLVDFVPEGDGGVNPTLRDPGGFAECALRRLRAGDIGPRPAPLYVRPADAAPPSDRPPVILDA